MQLYAVYTTVTEIGDAERIAHMAIERRLAACVQRETIQSVYRWQGNVEHATEVRLLLKTTAAAYPALVAWLHEHHPYALPAIYALPVAAASAAYVQWVEAEVAPPPTVA